MSIAEKATLYTQSCSYRARGKVLEKFSHTFEKKK